MPNNPHSADPLFTQVDIAAGSHSVSDGQSENHVGGLLRQLLAAQDRQNELLEELINQLSASQRNRAAELNQWKQANPQLATKCRTAAETLSHVQAEFLHSLTEEVENSRDGLMDGEFLLNEFVDRYGPRLAHLNGVLQILSQLSSATATADANNPPRNS